MGREIRRVPVDWQHPTEMDQYKKYGGQYPQHPDSHHPLFDRSYAEASAKWKRELAAWEAGEDNDRADAEARAGHSIEYWDYNGMPPDESYYRDRTWTVEEATAYQIYENVTEGTPVSPVCATRVELHDWLVSHQNMTPAAANAFIDQGWMFSGMVYPEQGVVLSNYQQFDADAKPFE